MNVTVKVSPLGDAIDLLKLHALNPERYPHLLCSASDGEQGGENSSRYHILFAFPEETLCLTSNGLSSDLPGLEAAVNTQGNHFAEQNFLSVFDLSLIHI